MRFSAVLAALSSTAACLGSQSTFCADGTACPPGFTCATVAPYCVSQTVTSACDGKPERDACTFVDADTSQVVDGVCLAGVCAACSPDVAGCHYLGWLPMTNPTSANLTSVVSVAEGVAYAVGASSTVLAYRGDRWVAEPPPPAIANPVVSVFSGVWAATLDRPFLIAGDTVHWRTDAGWSQHTAGDNLQAIWGASETAVFAVGLGGTIIQFDGTSWSSVATTNPADTIKSIGGRSATDVIAVGYSVIYRYDGATWTRSMTADRLNAVWVSPSGTEWTAGIGVVLRDGQRATLPASISTGTSLTSVWGTSDTDVFVAGPGLILHFDGTAWIELEVPGTLPIDAIAGSGPREVFAVGTNGTIWRYTGAAWTKPDPITNGTTRTRRAITGGASNDVVVVGDESSIVRHAGTAWSETATPGTPPLEAVWRGANGELLAVGGDGRAVRSTDGTTWTTVPVDAQAALEAITSLGTDVYAIGDVVRRFDRGATRWVAVPEAAAVSVPAHAMWTSSDGALWVGDIAGITRYRDWARVDDHPSMAAVVDVTGTAPDHVVAVAGPEVLTFDGTRWTGEAIGSNLRDAWASSANDVFVAGDGGELFHFDGGAWTRATLPGGSTADLRGVWSSGSTVYVVGSGGAIFRLRRSTPAAP